MKPIFIILLVSGICFGQTKDSVKTISVVCTVREIPDPEIHYFIHLYNLYEKECYSDSTEITEHVKNNMPCCHYTLEYRADNNYPCQTSGHYDRKIWIHKQPTFEGFIKYLRERYK